MKTVLGARQVTFEACFDRPDVHPALAAAPEGAWHESPPREPGWRAVDGTFSMDESGDGAVRAELHVPGTAFTGATIERAAGERFWVSVSGRTPSGERPEWWSAGPAKDRTSSTNTS